MGRLFFVFFSDLKVPRSHLLHLHRHGPGLYSISPQNQLRQDLYGHHPPEHPPHPKQPGGRHPGDGDHCVYCEVRSLDNRGLLWRRIISLPAATRHSSHPSVFSVWCSAWLWIFSSSSRRWSPTLITVVRTRRFELLYVVRTLSILIVISAVCLLPSHVSPGSLHYLLHNSDSGPRHR